MSVRGIRGLAEHRRDEGRMAAAAKGEPDPAGPPTAGNLEAAVPTEIVVFYTTVIAACEAVLRDSDNTMTAFRIWLFAGTLVITIVVSLRQVVHATAKGMDAVKSAEWWTAVVAFVAWGLVVPGSFLYSTLDRDQLVVAVATITAGAGLLLGTALAPNLSRPVGSGRQHVRAESLSLFEPGPDEPTDRTTS